MPNHSGAAKINYTALMKVMEREGDLPYTQQIAWDTVAVKGTNNQTVIWQDGSPIIVFPYPDRVDHARFCMFGWNSNKTRERISSLVECWGIHKIRQTIYAQHNSKNSQAYKVDEFGAFRLTPDGKCKKLMTATSHEGMVNVL